MSGAAASAHAAVANDPNKWGADAIFNLKDDKLSLAGYYKMPAAQSDTENCVAHNGSLVPVPGRDIEVQAWYQGGVSVMDFTDTAHPFEIAYFDRGPIDAKQLVLGGEWSAYWYNGYIYGSEIARGLDVFKLVPSKFLTQNEIDAAKLVKVERTQRAEPAADYLAFAVNRRPGLRRSTGTLAGFAGEPDFGSQKANHKRAEVEAREEGPGQATEDRNYDSNRRNQCQESNRCQAANGVGASAPEPNGLTLAAFSLPKGGRPVACYGCGPAETIELPPLDFDNLYLDAGCS